MRRTGVGVGKVIIQMGAGSRKGISPGEGVSGRAFWRGNTARHIGPWVAPPPPRPAARTVASAASATPSTLAHRPHRPGRTTGRRTRRAASPVAGARRGPLRCLAAADADAGTRRWPVVAAGTAAPPAAARADDRTSDWPPRHQTTPRNNGALPVGFQPTPTHHHASSCNSKPPRAST
jgi:hypothetical protein